MLRPEPVVLPEDACGPPPNLVVPPPNRFTHELARPLAYHFAGARAGGPPDGEFPAGTRVVLLRDEGGGRCRVADGRGFHAEVDCDGLKRL